MKKEAKKIIDNIDFKNGDKFKCENVFGIKKGLIKINQINCGINFFILSFIEGNDDITNWYGNYKHIYKLLNEFNERNKLIKIN